MNLPYASYQVEPTPSQSGVTTIHRPVIPFRVLGSTSGAVFYGLVDTGSDETILPRALATLIGIATDPANSVTMLTASGEIDVGYGQVTFELGKGKNLCRWSATFGIIDQPWEKAILGHAGFLQYFYVTLFGEKKQIRFRRNQSRLPTEA
jgi:hypothetical protein